MGREPRYIPPNSLQHVVDVFFQNRGLLSPSPEITERVLGVLGRAQRKHRMEIYAVVVLATHLHLLLRPRDGQHLASFMCFFKTNLSKKIGELRNWPGALFHERYSSITVSTEERAQARVLKYVLAHGVKEDLVESVREWPGVHSAGATIDGRVMVGAWSDKDGDSESVVISPLPCWQHLAPSVWRRAVAGLVRESEAEAAALRRETGSGVLGVEGIKARDPEERPGHVERSPKPRFHASDPQVRRRMLEIYGRVLAAYREASSRVRRGVSNVVFPEGTFPPAAPFVPFSPQTLIGVGAGRGQPF